jgi:hypothetical protein
MRIIGCDLHARQQTLAMLDTTTGEVVNATLKHEGSRVREFNANLPRPARVGIEATGSMQWFVNLMEELGIECLVGHPAEIVPTVFEANCTRTVLPELPTGKFFDQHRAEMTPAVEIVPRTYTSNRTEVRD